MKVVVITGASSGIGLATASLLAENGFEVFSLSRSAPADKNIRHISCDITDREALQGAFDTIIKESGGIYAVVNNAGMGISGPVEFAPWEDVDRIIQTNFSAVAHICAIALPWLRKSQGRIVNLSSLAAEFPVPFQALYSSTKAAVKNFSLALANEVRPFGIKISCILPGDTKTNFTQNRVKACLDSSNVYNQRTCKNVGKMEKDEQNGMEPIHIARLILKCLTKKHPPLVKTVGFKYKILRAAKRVVTTKTLNSVLYSMYGK